MANTDRKTGGSSVGTIHVLKCCPAEPALAAGGTGHAWLGLGGWATPGALGETASPKAWGQGRDSTGGLLQAVMTVSQLLWGFQTAELNLSIQLSALSCSAALPAPPAGQGVRTGGNAAWKEMLEQHLEEGIYSWWSLLGHQHL